ncbi:MAG: PQQ-binding-like beta-propeller repeat protein, partial [Eubacteriaceae bacterium]|nr:PQQ-binding-like beta-propeller repeat protein [Eubacteriaceae bacterium]
MKKHNRLKKSLSMLLILAMVLTMSPVSAFASTAVSGNETRDAYGVDTEWYNYRNNQENNGITDSKTPIDPDTTSLKWSGIYGTGWSAAPTPPLILNGKIYVGMSNKVIEIDKETGEKLRESDAMIGNVGFAMNPITYADGKIFVQIQNGIVQALDLDTLTCVWHTPKIGGQTVSPISHVTIDGKGYVYTGIYTGESADGSYICFSTDDSDLTDVDETKGGGKIKALKWRFTPATQLTEATENVTSETFDEALAAAEDVSKRGFYWAGAYVTEKYVAVGSDNGAKEENQGVGAVFYTLNPMTGEVIDRITGIKGDIRTTTVYDNGYLYFATKGGIVYKAKVSEDGHLSDISSIDIAAATGNTGAQATASPLVYGNKIYMGLKGPGGQLDADGGHSFKVIDNSGTLTQDSIMYEMPIPGYPQAAALATTAYVNEDFDADGNADGRVYIYFTYNATPGGIYYCYDTADQTESKADQTGALYIPPADKQNYCSSTICADREGTLYYKNDSCYLMAIEKNIAKINNITVTAEEGKEIKWDKGFDPTITEYELTYPVENQKAKISLDLAEGISATIDGKEYTGEVEIDTPKETKTVTIIASSSDDEKDYTKEYTLKFRALSDDSNLGGIKVSGTSSAFGSSIDAIPEFDSATKEYFADGSVYEKFLRVWLKKSDANATIEVTGDSNVKKIDAIAGTASTDDYERWNVYKVDPNKSAVLDVKVTAEDGRTVSNYKVTLYGKESTEVISSVQQGNGFLTPVETLDVGVFLAESYGYEDQVRDGISPLDVLVAKHEKKYGDQFTKENCSEYLEIDSQWGSVSKMFGMEAFSSGFAVNGRYPKDSDGYGTTITTTKLEEGDKVQFFFYQDLDGWSDNICEISIDEDILIAGTAIEAKLTGYSYMWYGHETDENIAAQINPISNAQFALIDENGAVTPIEGAVTDEDGCATFSIDAAGTYLLTAYTEPSEDNGLSPLIMPVKKITVHSHSFTEEVAKDEALTSPATCESDAVYFKSCSCGEISTTDTFIAEGTALGHSFTKYVPDGNATCTTDGTKTAVCDREGCDV